MQPLVGLIMGSDSDWDTVAPAAEVLAEFGIPFEVGVVSAHRTPDKMLATPRVRTAVGCARSSPARAVRPICPGWSPRRPRCR